MNAIARGVGYVVVENASLEGRTTFRVPARAEMLIDVQRREALPELFAFEALRSQPVLILGGGSNILFTRDWPGIVVSIVSRGIEKLGDDGDAARIRVAAGENWNDLVHYALAKGYAGLENLVLIPGSVGAAPMQNIGAYGVEVREFIEAVEAFDRTRREFVRIANGDCGFGYRDSIFKRNPDRFVITAVEFRLPRRREPRIDYAGVREEIATLGDGAPTPARIAEAISRIRLRKLPNPDLVGNAGSFFKNPVVGEEDASRLRAAHPEIAMWPAGEATKISAAWLVEAAGFKGFRDGDAGVSDRHALVLVNHGHASGAAIGRLAERIRAEVRARFGVELVPEPLLV